MKESVGFTVSLNIMVVFITIVVAFLSFALIYFKSYKVSNMITSAIEKYEKYDTNSIREINRNLSSIGYNIRNISCDNMIVESSVDRNRCDIVSDNNGRGRNGYCVYLCNETGGEYYYYKIRTNMMINIPIINNFLDIPIWANTNRLYNFTIIR